MPVQIASFLIPKNGAQWYLMEDRFLKGGFQTVPTSVERDAILEENRKQGMLVWVQSDSSLWQLTYDMVTWINLQLGGIAGDTGATGERGEKGDAGKDGEDAYALWLKAGNVGAIEDYFATFKGEKGDTGAAGENGTNGIAGEKGDAGESVFDEWLAEGNVGSFADFMQTLEGKSAYDVWIAAGNVGTTEDFFASQKGAKGDSLKINAVGPLHDRADHDNEELGFTFLDEDAGQLYILTSVTDPKWSNPIAYSIGIQGPQGEVGADGKSSYQVWLDAGNIGTVDDYLLLQTGPQGDQGLKGDRGDIGLQGDIGNQGPQGIKGDKGDTGAAAKSPYQIWLDNGNTGTVDAYLLSLKGAKGDQGDVGTHGDTGESIYQVWLEAGNTGTETDFLAAHKGDKGDKGDTGSQGLKGDTGTRGELGDQGPQGIQGIKGDKGDIGLTGDRGLQGDKGDTGAKGDTGDKGEIGLTGPQGEVGDTGNSIYQVWLDEGNVGTQADFLLAQKGAKGDQGIQGVKGDTGPAGSIGDTTTSNFTVNGTLSYKNIFANLAAFPDATVFEGMFGVAEDTNKAYFSSDGIWVEIAIAVDRIIPYDISFFIPGSIPVALELVGAALITRTIAISMNGSGSLAKALTAPVSQIVYAIKVNGTDKGTITFGAGVANGVIAFTQNLTLVAGDIVEIFTPNATDTSIKDVMITFVGRAQAPQLSMSFV